jgi:hypothetical protein
MPNAKLEAYYVDLEKMGLRARVAHSAPDAHLPPWTDLGFVGTRLQALHIFTTCLDGTNLIVA